MYSSFVLLLFRFEKLNPFMFGLNAVTVLIHNKKHQNIVHLLWNMKFVCFICMPTKCRRKMFYTVALFCLFYLQRHFFRFPFFYFSVLAFIFTIFVGCIGFVLWSNCDSFYGTMKWSMMLLLLRMHLFCGPLKVLFTFFYHKIATEYFGSGCWWFAFILIKCTFVSVWSVVE